MTALGRDSCGGFPPSAAVMLLGRSRAGQWDNASRPPVDRWGPRL